MNRQQFLRLLPVGLLLLGGVLRLFFILQSPAYLVSKVLPDDAFYYATVSYHAATGQGISFDGQTPTNGFHPLWAMILVPFYAAIPEKWAALRASLGMGIILDLAAAWLLASTADRFRPGTRNFVLALYLLNPRSILGAVCGVETPAVTFTLAAAVSSAASAWRLPSWRQFAWLGMWFGLAFLARTDLAFVLLTVGGGLFLELLLRANLPLGKLVRWGGLAVAIAFLVVLPWWFWNFFAMGTLVQSSGVALPEYILTTLPNNPDYWKEFQFSMTNLSLRLAITYPGLSWLALLVTVLWVRLRRLPNLRRLLPQRKTPGQGPFAGFPLFLLLGPILGALAMIGTHIFVRWFVRDWYFPPLALSVIFLGGIALAYLVDVLPSRAGRACLLLLGFLLVFQGARVMRESNLPGQIDKLTTATWFQENTPPDTVIGAFNAGILGFTAERTVINLDGVVDWGAIEARRENRILAYLQERGGTYLADRWDTIHSQFVPFLGPEAETMEEIIQLGDPDQWRGPMYIYKLKDK